MRRELAFALSASLLAAAPALAEDWAARCSTGSYDPLMSTRAEERGCQEKLDAMCLRILRLENELMGLETDLMEARMRLREHEIERGLREIQELRLEPRERAKRAVEFLKRLKADEP